MKSRNTKKLTLVLAAALVPMLFAQTCTVTLPRGFDVDFGRPNYHDNHDDVYVGFDTYYEEYYYDDYYYDDYYYDDSYYGGGFFDWFSW